MMFHNCDDDAIHMINKRCTNVLQINCCVDQSKLVEIKLVFEPVCTLKYTK